MYDYVCVTVRHLKHILHNGIQWQDVHKIMKAPRATVKTRIFKKI
jgi:hypothetical protein